MNTKQQEGTPAIMLWKITGTNIYCITRSSLNTYEKRINAIHNRIKRIVIDNEITNNLEVIYYGEEDTGNSSISYSKFYIEGIINYFSKFTPLNMDKKDLEFLVLRAYKRSLSNTLFFVTLMIEELIIEVNSKFNKETIYSDHVLLQSFTNRINSKVDKLIDPPSFELENTMENPY